MPTISPPSFNTAGNSSSYQFLNQKVTSMLACSMYSAQVKSSYQIEYLQKVLGFFVIRKNIAIKVSASTFETYRDMPEVKSHLDILGVKVARVLGYNFVRMDAWPDAGRIFLHVYLVDDGKEKFPIVRIMDIFMKPKYRALGIGSELIRLITEIADQNSARVIFGVLEAKEDLEARKRFFIKNGFELVENSGFGLSNICATKFIKNSR